MTYKSSCRYDWASQPNAHEASHCHGHPRQPHFPMQWGWWSNTHTNLRNSDHFVLGFNEPNHGNQANLRPDVAATYWMKMQNETHGKTLVSPSAAPGGYMQPVEWFTEFFHHCQGCKVDFLATHAYWCNAHQVMDYLHDLYTRFGKKIWLTEFCCQYTTNPDDQLNFMKQILPLLEKAHYVDRYSWFIHRVTSEHGFVTKSASLLEPYNSDLTPLGHYYNNFAA